MINTIRTACILTLFFCILCFVIEGVVNAKIDEDTIVCMWTFDEASGKTVKDSSKNDNDGTIVGDINRVDAQFGKGLEFSGAAAQNFVRIGTKGDADSLAALDFKESEGFSVHAWVKAASDPTGKVIIFKGLGCATWSQWYFGTGATENNENHTQATFHIRPTNGGGKQEARGSELPVDTWVHLVGVWDGKQLSMYVDGELANSTDAVELPWASPEEVYIGADPGCGNGNGRGHWHGIIDEIVIFNVALSQGDVKSLGRGIERSAAVDAVGKTTTTWAAIKRKNN